MRRTASPRPPSVANPQSLQLSSKLLKWGIVEGIQKGSIIGLIKGHTRSLDYSSFALHASFSLEPSMTDPQRSIAGTACQAPFLSFDLAGSAWLKARYLYWGLVGNEGICHVGRDYIPLFLTKPQ